MKKIFLIRHAKSDWGHESLADIDRPLNQRGYDEAYLASSLLKKKNFIPDLLISSSATRAISTCFIFSRNFNFPEKDVIISNKIYEASSSILQETIKNINNKYSSIMLFGHNPGLTNLFNEISDAYLDNLPTCAVVMIQFESQSWNNIFTKKGEYTFSQFPKDFNPK